MYQLRRSQVFRSHYIVSFIFQALHTIKIFSNYFTKQFVIHYIACLKQIKLFLCCNEFRIKQARLQNKFYCIPILMWLFRNFCSYRTYIQLVSLSVLCYFKHGESIVIHFQTTKIS